MREKLLLQPEINFAPSCSASAFVPDTWQHKNKALSHWQDDPGLQIWYDLKQVRDSKIKCQNSATQLFYRKMYRASSLSSISSCTYVNQLWTNGDINDQNRLKVSKQSWSFNWHLPYPSLLCEGRQPVPMWINCEPMETSMIRIASKFQNKVEVSIGICLIVLCFARDVSLYLCESIVNQWRHQWSESPQSFKTKLQFQLAFALSFFALRGTSACTYVNQLWINGDINDQNRLKVSKQSWSFNWHLPYRSLLCEGRQPVPMWINCESIVNQLWINEDINDQNRLKKHPWKKYTIENTSCRQFQLAFAFLSVFPFRGRLPGQLASHRWSDVGISGKNVCSFINGMTLQLHILLPKICDLYENLKCAMYAMWQCAKAWKLAFRNLLKIFWPSASLLSSPRKRMQSWMRMQGMSCEKWSVPCATKDAYTATKETIQRTSETAATHCNSDFPYARNETTFAPKMKYSQLAERWPWLRPLHILLPGVQRWRPSMGSCCGQNAQETSMKEVSDFVGILTAYWVYCIQLRPRHVATTLHVRR